MTEQHDWLGIALTHSYKEGPKTITVDVTDEWAITYAANKFDVDEDDIILERDNSMIRVRVREDDEEDYIEFLTYDQYIQAVYGFPMKTDPHYETLRKFGYRNWLVKTYPEEFGTGDMGIKDASLRLDYEFYRLEEWLDVTDEKAFYTALGASLLDQPIFTLKSKIPLNLPLKLTSNTFAILIWPELAGQFVLIVEDGELYPFVMPDRYLVDTDEVFGGFE